MAAQIPLPSAGSGVEVYHHFPVLDTLRAVGALAVVTTHTAFWAGAFTRNGIWGAVLNRLDVGVALFFVLSGFLLSRPYLARSALGIAAPSTTAYLWKRVRRIMPVYVVTATAAAVFIDQRTPLGIGGWLQTLFMTNIYTSLGTLSGLTHMWSLAVEVSFYLLLPLLMLPLVVGRRLRPWAVGLLFVVLAGVTAWWHLEGLVQVREISVGSPLQWLPGYLLWFAGGIVLAYAHVAWQSGRSPWLTRPLTAAAALPGSCWAVASGLLLISATPLAGPRVLEIPTPVESLTKALLYAGIGVAVVLTGVFAHPTSSYTRFMSHRVGRHLGATSYSLFCVHLPVLHFVMWATGWQLFAGRGWSIWGVTLAASLVVAELTHRLVERPAMAIRVPHRRAKRPERAEPVRR